MTATFTINDSDGDNLADTWETAYYGNLSAGASDDLDNDGLTAYAELVAGTNPVVSNFTETDTDGDGLPDSYESANGLDLTDPSDALKDNDGDGYSNYHEYLLGLDPQADNSADADTDGDGIIDTIEVALGTDPDVDDSTTDPDGDGLTSYEEMMTGTLPLLDNTAMVDSDGDGIPDTAEILAGLDPYFDNSLTDSDGDELTDLVEYYNGTLSMGNGSLVDSDSDGLPDMWEEANGLGVGTDNSSSDTDGDGVSDVGEYQTGMSPLVIDHYTITVSAGPNGSVTPVGPVIVRRGASQAFIVEPNTSYHINAVSGCGGILSGNTFTTGSITSDCNINISFAVNMHSLTITPAGTGAGIVNSVSSGISCGSDCSASYAHGTIVTLEAYQVLGSEFSGWSGAGCSGTGECVVTVSGNMAVTATFNDIAAPSVKITSPSAGITNNSTPVLSYTVSDGTVKVIVNGIPVSKVSGEALSTLPEGLNTLRLEAKDAAGNTGHDEVSITVDTISPVTTALPSGGLDDTGFSVTLNCSDTGGQGCDKTYFCMGDGCTPALLYSGSPINISRTGDLRFFSIDMAENYEDVQTETYTIGAVGCFDAGAVECLERSDDGVDTNNLISGSPSVDVLFNFILYVVETSGSTPQSVKLYMSQRTNPSLGDFYPHEMTCSGNISAVATCVYQTKLGPADIHLYYFEVITSNGTEIRYPDTGYLTGPSIEMPEGYNLIGIPRDINSANLDGNMAFGSSRVFRWNNTENGYSQVSSLDPVVAGEGYFVLRQRNTIPEHAVYNEIQNRQYVHRLDEGVNIISNPYGGNVRLTDLLVQRGTDVPVTWVEAVTNGWLVNAVYYYQGDDHGGTYGFETEPDAMLVPWMGYWMELNMNDETYYLIIPKP